MNLQLNRSFYFLTALLLVHLLFFLSALIRDPAPLSDSQEYLNASRNLYHQGVLYCGDLSLPIVEEQFTRRPPLYPLLLGVTVMTGAPFPIYILQLLISLFSAYLVTRIFFHTRQRLIFMLGFFMFFTTPAQFIYTNRMMAEITFQLLLVLMALSVYQLFRERKDSTGSNPHYIWLFNLSLTLGMATKPVLYPFAILSILLSLILYLKSRNRAFLLALILPVFWITLYSIWNYNRTGSAQYSSIQTANMINYNLRYYLINQQGNDAASAAVDSLYAKCGNEINYKEKMQCLQKGAVGAITEHPLSYGLFHIKGVFRYFLDPGRFDLVNFFNLKDADATGFLKTLNQEGMKGAIALLKDQGGVLVIILLFLAFIKIIKLTGFLLYLFGRDHPLQFRIFLAILVLYLAMVTGPLGASRFYLPVEILIIGAAAAGWLPVFLRRKQQPIVPGS